MASTMNPTPDDTADRLIERAAEILAEQGPDGLSIRKVAAAARTSTMAVYTHFGSKADLVRAVVERGFSLLSRELARVEVSDDPVADLVALGRAYRAMAPANANRARGMFTRSPPGLADPSAYDPEPPDTAAIHSFTGIDAFSHLASATRRFHEAGAGPAAAADTGSLTLALWGLVNGCVDLELAGFLDDGASVLSAAVSAFLVDPDPKTTMGRG